MLRTWHFSYILPQKCKIQTFCSWAPAPPLLCSSYSHSSFNCTSLITMHWRGAPSEQVICTLDAFSKAFRGGKKINFLFKKKRKEKEEGGDFNHLRPSSPGYDSHPLLSDLRPQTMNLHKPARGFCDKQTRGLGDSKLERDSFWKVYLFLYSSSCSSCAWLWYSIWVPMVGREWVWPRTPSSSCIPPFSPHTQTPGAHSLYLTAVVGVASAQPCGTPVDGFCRLW